MYCRCLTGSRSGVSAGHDGCDGDGRQQGVADGVASFESHHGICPGLVELVGRCPMQVAVRLFKVFNILRWYFLDEYVGTHQVAGVSSAVLVRI